MNIDPGRYGKLDRMIWTIAAMYLTVSEKYTFSKSHNFSFLLYMSKAYILEPAHVLLSYVCSCI